MEKLNPKRKLPVFKAFIDEDFAEIDGEQISTGLNAISFVYYLWHLMTIVK
jgi:hypothetical protein